MTSMFERRIPPHTLGDNFTTAHQINRFLARWIPLAWSSHFQGVTLEAYLRCCRRSKGLITSVSRKILSAASAFWIKTPVGELSSKSFEEALMRAPTFRFSKETFRQTSASRRRIWMVFHQCASTLTFSVPFFSERPIWKLFLSFMKFSIFAPLRIIRMQLLPILHRRVALQKWSIWWWSFWFVRHFLNTACCKVKKSIPRLLFSALAFSKVPRSQWTSGFTHTFWIFSNGTRLRTMKIVLSLRICRAVCLNQWMAETVSSTREDKFKNEKEDIIIIRRVQSKPQPQETIWEVSWQEVELDYFMCISWQKTTGRDANYADDTIK